MPEIREYEANGKKFQIGVLDIKKQMYVAKRVMSGLNKIAKEEDKAGDSPNENSGAASTPDAPPPDPASLDPETRRMVVMGFVRQAIFALGDAESDFVLGTCLNVVRRFDENAAGGSWRPVLVGGGGLQLRDGDITLNEMINLAVEVVENNLGNFFLGSVSSS